MKSYCAILLLASFAQSALGGTIIFNNRVFGEVVAPVYGPEPSDASLALQGNAPSGTPAGTVTYSGTLLAGSGYTAELWAGPLGTPESLLTPVPGAVTTFRTDRPGFIVPVPSVVDIPGVGTGGQAVLQLRVWENATAGSWSAVLLDPTVLRGVSIPFPSLPLGGPNPGAPDSFPPSMNGLTSFNIHSLVVDPCLSDTTAPIISLNDVNPLTVECHTPFVDPGATATDNCPPLTAPVSVSGVVDPNTPGTYVITYSATDANGNTGTATRTVNVVDTTSPSITISGANPFPVECGAAFVDPGATAADACDSSVTVIASGAVNSSVPGNYTITYSATDDSGNTLTTTRTVVVADTTAAVLTLNGVNPLAIECQSTFTDPGATASDTCAGSVSVSSSGAVDPNTPGSYTLTYTATDPSGNTATATRIVNVNDTLAPGITLNGANPYTVECHTPFVDPGATASDTCAGPVSVSVSGTVDADTPGSYTLTYTSTDPSGNTATATRTVTVVDTTPPLIALNGPDPLTVPCGGPFVDPGATATDTCTGGALPVTTVGTVDVNTPGDYTVTYSAQDSALNSASVSRVVRVGNCVGPVLTCPPPIQVAADPGTCSATVSFADPTVSGGTGAVTLVCNPPSGSVFPVGQTTVTCIGTDSIGQTGTCTFTVTVDDEDAPSLTCPPDVTISCLDIIPAPNFAGGVVSDFCDAAPTVLHIGDVPTGSNPTIIVRTYEATDFAGNSVTCEQSITILGRPGDLNGDCCVDRTDLDLLMVQIRARSGDLSYDINGDGHLDIADARSLVLLFTNPGGAPCP